MTQEGVSTSTYHDLVGSPPPPQQPMLSGVTLHFDFEHGVCVVSRVVSTLMIDRPCVRVLGATWQGIAGIGLALVGGVLSGIYRCVGVACFIACWLVRNLIQSRSHVCAAPRCGGFPRRGHGSALGSCTACLGEFTARRIAAGGGRLRALWPCMRAWSNLLRQAHLRRSPWGVFFFLLSLLPYPSGLAWGASRASRAALLVTAKRGLYNTWFLSTDQQPRGLVGNHAAKWAFVLPLALLCPHSPIILPSLATA